MILIYLSLGPKFIINKNMKYDYSILRGTSLRAVDFISLGNIYYTSSLDPLRCVVPRAGQSWFVVTASLVRPRMRGMLGENSALSLS